MWKKALKIPVYEPKYQQECHRLQETGRTESLGWPLNNPNAGIFSLSYTVCFNSGSKENGVSPSRNLARCEGLQLMRVTSSGITLPKSAHGEGGCEARGIVAVHMHSPESSFGITQQPDERKDALSLVDVCFGHSTTMVILLIHKLFYAEETY